MDLLKRYIRQGRFGAFIQGFLEAEAERKRKEAQKDEDWKLWMAYIHSETDKSFNEWKKQIFQPSSTTKKAGKSDADLDDDGIMAIINAQFADPMLTE